MFLHLCLSKARIIKKIWRKGTETDWKNSHSFIRDLENPVCFIIIFLLSTMKGLKHITLNSFPILRSCDLEKVRRKSSLGSPLLWAVLFHYSKMYLDSSKCVLTLRDKMSSFRSDRKAALQMTPFLPSPLPSKRAFCQCCYNPTAHSQLEQKRQ